MFSAKYLPMLSIILLFNFALFYWFWDKQCHTGGYEMWILYYYLLYLYIFSFEKLKFELLNVSEST